MKIQGNASLLRIYIRESERHGHQALYEALISEARDAGMAGATAWRGIRGFGPGHGILSSRILDLASDLPIVVEIVDTEEKVKAFLERANTLLEEAESGGLATLEKAAVIRYVPVPESG